MTFAENTHVTFTNSAGDDVIGIVKGHKAGKYVVQLRHEISTNQTEEVDESKVKELKISNDSKDACPVVGGSK